MLGLTVWEAHDLLAAEGVPVAHGTRNETAANLAAVLANVASGEDTESSAAWRREPRERNWRT